LGREIGIMRIIGFAGSLRKGSYNKMLLANAAEIARGQGAEVEVLGLEDIPPYNFDVEQAGLPAPVAQFKEKIANADALLIASPEYNYSVSGVLKNAIDWASRPSGSNSFKGKVAAIMGASNGNFGTARMQKELREILRQLDVWVIPTPDMLVSKAQDAFDENGKFKDKAQEEKLGKLVARLIETVKKLA